MKKLIVGHSEFVLAFGGWLEPSVLWTEGDHLPVHKAVMCLLVSRWRCQRNTRCETGRGPNILLLRFAREFAVNEILMLLHLQQLPPFPFLPPSYFFSSSSTLFPWPSPLLRAPSLPLLCSVSALTVVVSAVQKAEERGTGWWLSPHLESGVTCPVTVPGIFSSPSGCWAWHVPFLVTIQPVSSFSKNSSILPHVTRWTCTSLFC